MFRPVMQEIQEFSFVIPFLLEKQEELAEVPAALMLLKHEVVADEISCGGGSSQILVFTTTPLTGHLP
jgi:hypothetical protein